MESGSVRKPEPFGRGSHFGLRRPSLTLRVPFWRAIAHLEGRAIQPPSSDLGEVGPERDTLKRTAKKISLHRETLRDLSVHEMEDAAGGSVVVSPPPGFTQSCIASACVTCGCPTRVQNCTTRC